MHQTSIPRRSASRERCLIQRALRNFGAISSGTGISIRMSMRLDSPRPFGIVGWIQESAGEADGHAKGSMIVWRLYPWLLSRNSLGPSQSCQIFESFTLRPGWSSGLGPGHQSIWTRLLFCGLSSVKYDWIIGIKSGSLCNSPLPLRLPKARPRGLQSCQCMTCTWGELGKSESAQIIESRRPRWGSSEQQILKFEIARLSSITVNLRLRPLVGSRTQFSSFYKSWIETFCGLFTLQNLTRISQTGEAEISKSSKDLRVHSNDS
jgi:hypothetical protein